MAREMPKPAAGNSHGLRKPKSVRVFAAAGQIGRQPAKKTLAPVFPIDQQASKNEPTTPRGRRSDGIIAFHLEFSAGVFARRKTTGPSYRVAASYAVRPRANLPDDSRRPIFRELDAISPRTSLVCAPARWGARKRPIGRWSCPNGHQTKLPLVIFLPGDCG